MKHLGRNKGSDQQIRAAGGPVQVLTKDGQESDMFWMLLVRTTFLPDMQLLQCVAVNAVVLKVMALSDMTRISDLTVHS